MEQDFDQPLRTRSTTITPDNGIQPAAESPAPHRSFGPGILAAVGMAALAAGFGIGWASHTGGSKSNVNGGPTVAVHGMLQLGNDAYDSTGTTCYGTSGYNDISGGIAVTIGDQAGKTLAVTSLQPGKFANGGCELDFATQVPAGATLYTVVISHRGTQTFSPADIGGGFN